MGPVRATTCSFCGAKVSIPYVSLFGLTFYFFLIMMITILSPNMALSILLLIVSVVVWSYAFYKFVPLIVKPEIKDYKYHIKNISIMFVYFALSIFVYVNAISPSIFFFRQDIVDDLTQVQNILDDLGSHLDDKDNLHSYLTDARVELMAIGYEREGHYRLTRYLEVWPIFRQLNKLSEDINNQAAMDDLREIIKLGHEHPEIRDKDIYTYAFGFNTRYHVPQGLKAYEKELFRIVSE